MIVRRTFNPRGVFMRSICKVALMSGISILLASAWSPAAESDPATARAAAQEKSEKVLDGFLAACRENENLTDQQRDQIASLVSAARQDAAARSQAITAALSGVNDELRRALVELADEETPAAIGRLEKLAAGEDSYLAAEASFFLARAYLAEERYEEALPLLTEIIKGKLADRSLQAGEAQFYAGIVQAKLIKRRDAIKSLSAFLEQNPDASERLRVGALHQLEELKTLERGSILDVEDRMDYSRRRLALERSDKPTQTQQKTIIVMLDKLIEAAEEKEQSGSGSGKGKGKGKGRGKGNSPGGKGGKNPAGGAKESAAQAGNADVGPLHHVGRGKPEESWGGLKDKQRDEVLSALKTKFPDRYKQLLEQYYKSLQDEEK